MIPQTFALKHHVARLLNVSPSAFVGAGRLTGLDIRTGLKVLIRNASGDAILSKGTVTRIDVSNQTFEIEDERGNPRVYALHDEVIVLDDSEPKDYGSACKERTFNR